MMAIVKSEKTAPDFVVPRATDLDPEYRGLVDKIASINATIGKLKADAKVARRELDEAVTAAPNAAAMDPRIAVIVGDAEVVAIQAKRERLADINKSITDHEAANLHVQRRVTELRDRVARLVVAAVKPEFQRRIRLVAEKAVELEALRADVEALRADVEAEIGTSGHLVGDLHWLGAFDHRSRTSFHTSKLAHEAGLR